MSPLVTETREALARLTSVDDIRALVTGMAEKIDRLNSNNASIINNLAEVTSDHVAALTLINSVIDNLRKMVDMPRSAEAQRLAVQLLEALEKFWRNRNE